MIRRSYLLILAILAVQANASRDIVLGQLSDNVLPTEVKRLLCWLPTDTETIIVAQQTQTTPPPSIFDDEFDEKPNAAPLLFLDMTRLSATMLFGELPHTKQFWGRKLIVAVHAARDFRRLGPNGEDSYTGAEILVLESRDKLEGLQAIMDKAPRKLQIAGQTVAVYLLEEFEGDQGKRFFSQPEPGVLVTATDQVYLEQLLMRRAQKVGTEAFSNGLALWQEVNLAAPIWAIRKYRAEKATRDCTSPLSSEYESHFLGDGDRRDAKALGVAFWYDDAKNRAAILHASESSELNARMVAHRKGLADKGLASKVQQRSPQIVELSLSVDKDEGKCVALYNYVFYCLGHVIVY